MCLYYLHGQKLLGSRCVIRCRQRFFQAFHRTVTIQNQILKAHFFVKITICWLIYVRYAPVTFKVHLRYGD